MSKFYDLALELYNNQKYEDAIYYLLQAINNDNDNKIAICYYLSNSYKHVGDVDNQLKYLFKSFEYDVPRAEICCEIGYYHMSKENYKNAIFWFDLATKLDKPYKSSFYIPDYWDFVPNLQLCICYYKTGNNIEANKYNENAGKYKPNSPSVIKNKNFFNSILFDNTLEVIEEKKEMVKQIRCNYKDYPKPGVSIITPTNKSEYMNNIFENYKRLNYNPKELIIILNNNTLPVDEYIRLASKYENIKVFQLDELTTLGECLNYAVENSKYEYIAKIDDDDFYGENYLIDQMDVFNYTDAQVTGKAKWFNYFEHNNTLWIMKEGKENAMTSGIAGGTILAKKIVFDKIKFQNINFAEDRAFFNDCLKNGFKIYSSNKYNYIYMRHSNLESHTWKVDTKAIENMSTQVFFKGKDSYKDIVLV